MGSILRSTVRMTAAGWLIDKLEVKEPMQRTLAFGAGAIGIG
jgi:hypothetical protein